ncbi:hypothetical protein PFMC_00765 [Plasmodium falciparum CAMP/Malaysia]|uniref:Uncharacterized protein n=1 Tax=Plasmodium falciparum (isolate Camp / Malaysia) TaxID=5835 RepID=A0A024XDL9_PLAFC|nr:hypothetical protein PFMC_00765 [Plasmodium falciparum CAMP/Malaysia]
MGNEICGCQTEVSKKYNIDLDQFRKRYHEHYMNFLIKVLIIQIIYVNCKKNKGTSPECSKQKATTVLSHKGK